MIVFFVFVLLQILFAQEELSNEKFEALDLVERLVETYSKHGCSRQAVANKICVRPLPQLIQTSLNSLDPLYMIRPSGKAKLGSWKDVFDAVSASKQHVFCSIVRDIHACSGEVYSKVLRETAPFNDTKFGFHNLPDGSFVLAIGDYNLLELLYAPVCAAGRRGATGYKLGATDSFAIAIPPQTQQQHQHQSKSFGEGILLLLVDRDRSLEDPGRLASLLKNSGLPQPNFLLPGRLSDGFKSEKEMTTALHSLYPHAHIISSYSNGERRVNLDYILPERVCIADFQNCAQKSFSHPQCYPGPIVRLSELLMAELINKH